MSRTDSRWTLNPPQPAQPADFYGQHSEIPELSYYLIEISRDSGEQVTGYFRAEIAHLIAAAPALLAAVRGALSAWEFDRETQGNRNKDVTPEWVYSARAALAQVDARE